MHVAYLLCRVGDVLWPRKKTPDADADAGADADADADAAGAGAGAADADAGADADADADAAALPPRCGCRVRLVFWTPGPNGNEGTK